MDNQKVLMLVIVLVGIFIKQYPTWRKHKGYQKKWMPLLQKMSHATFGSQGSLITLAFDPKEWRTDIKSILLIVLGLPLGILLVFGVVIFVYSFFVEL